MSGIAGLVLAAGESSRMGRDKALLKYRGKTFLEAIVANLQQAGVPRIIVVLGHHAVEIQRQIDLSGVEWVVNPAYRLGQTTSLQAGLRIVAGAGVDGVMLCLADHPAAGAEVMRGLIEQFKETNGPVVIPVYQGTRGHPVMIGCTLFPELMALGVDDGANSVIRKHQATTRWLEVQDPGITFDVDNPEDYRRLNDRF
ncbi:MAG: nucleotidyltransferase family protein [Terriglobia bacterium]